MQIVIVSRSEPLEQMISYIVERGVEIEVVGEADNIPEAGQIISQTQPEWLFLLSESHSDMIDQLQEMRAGHTGLHIAAFHEGGEHVRILRGAKPGEDKALVSDDWDQISTSQFVAMLTEEPASQEQSPRLTDKDEHRA